MDYLVYAYLQKGENDLAKKQWDYLKTINEVYPVNFKVAYAFAAIPSRYVLENRLWKEASQEIFPANLAWQKFPWQKAIIHFTRLLGFVHIGKIDSARAELKNLNTIRDTLMEQKDSYKANQVQIQINTSKAWILFKEGKNDEALTLMNVAADMEDKTEKHPVTPGEVLPARELLADMLMQMNKPDKALEMYESTLRKHPNRFNSLYGAGMAAKKSGKKDLAANYFKQLSTITKGNISGRPELTSR